MILSNFKKVTSNYDINDKLEKQLSNFFKDLKKKGIITTEIHDSIKLIESYTPRLNSLPKVHKSDHLLRPVLDMYNPFYHKIAMWLVRILETLNKSVVRKSIKDVFVFTSNVKSMNVSMKSMI